MVYKNKYKIPVFHLSTIKLANLFFITEETVKMLPESTYNELQNLLNKNKQDKKKEKFEIIIHFSQNEQTLFPIKKCWKCKSLVKYYRTFSTFINLPKLI